MLRIAKLLEQFNMQWVEYDNWDPQALLQIKQSTSTRAGLVREPGDARGSTGRSWSCTRWTSRIIDVPWNGFSQAVQIGRMAEAYEINIAPHNYYSHLADLHSLHLCAVLPNVRIMEIDIDDVPWKAELVTKPPVIKDGHIFLPDGPGLGRRHQRGSAARAPVARRGRPRAELLRHEPRADAGAPVRYVTFGSTLRCRAFSAARQRYQAATER